MMLEAHRHRREGLPGRHTDALEKAKEDRGMNVLLFDVNETLLDLAALDEPFQG